MSDLIVAGFITRPELSLSNLSIQVPGQVRVVSYDPGGVVKRRVVAKSPTVAGHAQTGSVADTRVVMLGLRFYAASKAALDALAEPYFDAFDQSSYHLSITLDDSTTVWDCDDAEYVPVAPDGSGVHKYGLMATPRRQEFTFTIPVQPFALSGVY